MMAITVLLSGGVDSTLCAILAHERGILQRCLFFDYGQQAVEHERRAARKLAGLFAVPLVEQSLCLPVSMMNEVPGGGPRVVPNRNFAFMTAAQCLGVKHVWYGAIGDDYSDYADCRPEWIRETSESLQMTIEAPLIHLSKRDVVLMARDRRLPLDTTWSCYSPINGMPCDVCNSCIARNVARKGL